MAVKTLILLACVLLVTTMVSSIEEEVDVEQYPAKSPVKAPAHAPEKHFVHPPVKAPVHPPVKAPVHAPVKAPAHAPVKAPVHPPVKAPVHPPVKAPVHAPAKPPVATLPPVANNHGYCKTHHPKRSCMRECTACCAKCKCVPGSKKCTNWDHVTIHGAIVKCP
ncbi:hypothetical protein RJ640_029896 [Escallonia rubra]|uniref:Uncharacterized protein n=1 Tax=Escallonia rubra TaxID=112253 RepID=A0AA88U448_9ASTE|nr:hypothetical protein RJ640_029896 [Escallonia rubra]